MKIKVVGVDGDIITAKVDGAMHILTRSQFADIPKGGGFEINVFKRIAEIVNDKALDALKGKEHEIK